MARQGQERCENPTIPSKGILQEPSEEPGGLGGGLRHSIQVSFHLEHCLTRCLFSVLLRYETWSSRMTRSSLPLRADTGAIECCTTVSVLCNYQVLDF